MPRSSDSVAALAAALAKAQAELVNPEKSLTATIGSGRAGDLERSFRYAPLSSGLEIVRKTLSQHEIALVQTTAIDSAAGMVNLTTTLAHASGEWIASDWPVCAVSETATPRRMGAALTYARRYALFTLVGIAGEEDTDAPDLGDDVPSPAPSPGGPSRSANAGSARPSSRKPGNGYDRGVNGERSVVLDPDASAALRDKLTIEIARLTSPDVAATWAQAALADKNRLTASDAQLVEDGFERKLAELASLEPAAAPHEFAAAIPDLVSDTAVSAAAVKGTGAGQRRRVDKSVLKIAEPRRYRSKEHLRFVAQQACLVCGRKPSDPHHLRFMQPRAIGRKVSDEFTVPLCRVHHRAAHRMGDERAWWIATGIDSANVAQNLWQQSRGTGDPQPAQIIADSTPSINPLVDG